MRISDWSSDVCSSDYVRFRLRAHRARSRNRTWVHVVAKSPTALPCVLLQNFVFEVNGYIYPPIADPCYGETVPMNSSSSSSLRSRQARSEEHTSELQSLMRISYAVFCLKKKKHNQSHTCKLIYNNSKRSTRLKL